MPGGDADTSPTCLILWQLLKCMERWREGLDREITEAMEPQKDALDVLQVPGLGRWVPAFEPNFHLEHTERFHFFIREMYLEVKSLRRALQDTEEAFAVDDVLKSKYHEILEALKGWEQRSGATLVYVKKMEKGIKAWAKETKTRWEEEALLKLWPVN